MINCPKCGFDLSADALLRIRIVSEGVDAASYPRHVSGYFSDLEQLRKGGYVTRLNSGWYIPTDKLPHWVKET